MTQMNPDPSFSYPPQQQPIQQPYEQVILAPQRQPSNTGLWVVLAIVCVLLLAGLGVGGYFLVQNGKEDATPTTSTVVVPAPAQEQQQAPAAPAGPAAPVANSGVSFSTYYPATSVTSDGFAANVYSAYVANYQSAGALNSTITAYSPSTGLNYTMSCYYSGGVTTCSGGKNAVVKIY